MPRGNSELTSSQECHEQNALTALCYFDNLWIPFMSFIHPPVRVKKLKSRRPSSCLPAFVSVDKKLSSLLSWRHPKRASSKLCPSICPTLSYLVVSSTSSPQRFTIMQRKHVFLSFCISHVKISITSLSLWRDMRFETEVNQKLWL